MEEKKLIAAAFEARRMAYTPYSGFQVGAALLTADGHMYTGCNIESASYSPTNCAERTAFFNAVSQGERSFSAIAIVGGPRCIDGQYDASCDAAYPDHVAEYCPPCGVCRQVMMEFCSLDFKIILARSVEEYQIYDLQTLLPMGFGPGNLA